MKGLQLRAGHFFAAAAVVALLAPSFAVAQVPAGATAVCGDGSYSNTPTKRGACSGHKGIKTWLADQKPAPAAKAAKAAPRGTAKPLPPRAAAAAAKPAGATGVCGDGTYTSARSARGACSGHGGVKTWLTPPAGAPAAAPVRAPAPAAAAPVAKPMVPAARNAPPRAMPGTAPSPNAAPPAKANAAVNAANATALCNDGAYSASQHRRGACAGHGGVKQWLKEVAK